MMYGIFDTCDLSRPFIFQDQDKGTQEPAIFESRSKADRMAHMMNFVIKDKTFIVKEM
jgi:hypothetical protein